MHHWFGVVTGWAAGCACRDFLKPVPRTDGELTEAAKLLNAGRARGQLESRPGSAPTDGPDFQCPMRGKRGVELARGSHVAMMQD
eukprot:3156653-Alexandrium_andersonii.AAC.1